MKFELYKQERNVIVGILVCTLVAVIGYSFAYFLSGTSVIGEGARTDGTTAKLPTVTYNAGNAGLTLENAYPGKKATKEFTVTFAGNDSSKNEKIAIKLKITSNSFKMCSAVEDENRNGCDIDDNSPQLVAKLEKNGEVISGVDGTEIDLTGKTKDDAILWTDDISSDTTYTVTIEFKETGKDQGHNAGKNFIGSIEVEFADTEE